MTGVSRRFVPIRTVISVEPHDRFVFHVVIAFRSSTNALRLAREYQLVTAILLACYDRRRMRQRAHTCAAPLDDRSRSGEKRFA